MNRSICGRLLAITFSCYRIELMRRECFSCYRIELVIKKKGCPQFVSVPDIHELAFGEEY